VSGVAWHPGLRAKAHQLVEGKQRAHPVHVDARLLLRVDHQARGVGEGLHARRGHEPVGHGVGAHHGGEDARRSHQSLETSALSS